MKNIDMKQAIPQASEDEMNEKRIFIVRILAPAQMVKGPKE